MLLLGVLIALLSLLTIYNGDLLAGILMLALVIVVAIDTNISHIFAENGFIVDSKFIDWNNVKRWAFEPEKSILVVNHKKDFDEKTSYIKLRQVDLKEVDNLFKKFKLKK